MRKLVFVTLALVVATCTLAAATGQVKTIGNRAAGNYCPWWGAGHPAMRYMALWEKSELGLTAGGYINKVEWENWAANNATFYLVRAYFGHSTNTTLDMTFANNYSDTPVQVLNAATKTVSGAKDTWWDMGIDANKFNYNNTNNLVFEIRWRGTSPNAPCWSGNGGMKRMWAFDDAATVAAWRFGQIQYLRITIGTGTGVAPTSLGRVKSIFK